MSETAQTCITVVSFTFILLDVSHGTVNMNCSSKIDDLIICYDYK